MMTVNDDEQELIGEISTRAIRGIEVNYTSPVTREEFEQKLEQIPNTRDLILTEAALPLCYRHMEGVWDICDLVI